MKSWDRQVRWILVGALLLAGFAGWALGNESHTYRDLELACHQRGGAPGYAGWKAEENFYCKGVK